MKTRFLLVGCLLSTAFDSLTIPTLAQPVVSLEVVDRESAETRIDQNAIFWAEFRVVRTGPVTNDLFVYLNPGQGTARFGEDYRLDGVRDSSIRIPAGTNAANARLYPIDDDFYEGDEYAFLHLVAPAPGTVPYEIDLAHSAIEMIIHDNDPITTRLDIVSPQNGQQFQPGDTIELRAQIIGPVSSNSWSVEFFDGRQLIGGTPLSSSLRWNNASGGLHVINARTTDSQGTVLEAVPAVTIQVGPGASLPVVKILADPWKTGEPCPTCFVAPAILTIERTAPTNEPITVYLEVDGTATAGEDYEPLPAGVVIPAGQRSTQLKLLARDDQLPEGPEVVRMRVLPQPPPLLPPTYFVNVHSEESLVVIFDDEPNAPRARLDILTPTNGAHFPFPSTIELAALAVNTSNEVYGPVEFYAGDQLVARSQPVASTRPPVPGLPSVHTAYSTNPALGQYLLTARALLSFNESITSPPIKLTVDAASLPVVSLATSPPIGAQAPEFCPFNADCVYPSFVVRRTGPTTEDLRVYLSYSGTATPGLDYPAFPESVVIPAGHEAAFLTLVPKDDNLVEGPETVVVSFTPVPGPGYLQDPNHASAAIKILDNDGPQPTVVGIRAEDSRATELPPWVNSIDPARFRVSRSGDFSSDLMVFFSLDGSATPGLDYRALLSPVRIPAGVESATLEVWPIYDELKEGMETVLVHLEPSPLAGPLPSYGVDPHNDFAVAGIFDLLPEPAPVVQIVSPHEGQSFKTQKPIDIDTAAFHPTKNILGADLYVDGGKLDEWRLPVGTTNAGTLVAHRFTWSQPGTGPHVLTVRCLDESQNFFAISPPVGIVVEGESPRPVVRIETTSRVAEESSIPFRRLPLVGEFKISRSGPTNYPLLVYVAFSGTAIPGVDYKPSPLTVIIPEGADSSFLEIHAISDNSPEGLETVEATISNCPPPPVLPPCGDFSVDPAYATATVFIRDDGLTRASLRITEPETGAHFRLGEMILIEALAIDLEGYISQVEFFDGEQKLGVSRIEYVVAPPPGTPIHHTFEWLGATAGPHLLNARATGPDGSALVSPPVPISVGPADNRLPKLAIVKPLQGAQFEPNIAIEIIVQAGDSDGYVHTVEFFADGRKLGEAGVVFPRPPDPGLLQSFSFIWREPAPGAHVLTARAIDNNQGASLSGPVEIRVLPGLLPIVTVGARDTLAVEPSSGAIEDTAIFILRRFGETNLPLSVAYSMRGTAQNGVDFEKLSGIAVIPAGSVTATVAVRPLADQLAEGPESVIILLEPQPEYALGLHHRAAAFIEDVRPALGQTAALSTCLSDGCFHIRFAAPAGGNYRVEASSDLLHWETVFTAPSVDGAVEFVEDEAAGFARRFFRLAPEPGVGLSDY